MLEEKMEVECLWCLGKLTAGRRWPGTASAPTQVWCYAELHKSDAAWKHKMISLICEI